MNALGRFLLPKTATEFQWEFIIRHNFTPPTKNQASVFLFKRKVKVYRCTDEKGGSEYTVVPKITLFNKYNKKSSFIDYVYGDRTKIL